MARFVRRRQKGRSWLRPIVAVAALGLALSGCVAINEAITGRDVRCEGPGEAECLRLIDYALIRLGGDVNGPDFGPITSVLVTSMDCQFIDDAAAIRCWEVEFGTVGGGAGTQVYERADGTLGGG